MASKLSSTVVAGSSKTNVKSVAAINLHGKASQPQTTLPQFEVTKVSTPPALCTVFHPIGVPYEVFGCT